MTEQALFSDDTSWPMRNIAAVLVGILAMGMLLQMARPLFELFDIGLPWRQLTMNRNLKVLVVSCHVLFVITCSYITTRQSVKLLNEKINLTPFVKLLNEKINLTPFVEKINLTPFTARTFT